MKNILLLSLLNITLNAFSQKTDFIKYLNGYLHYHSYGKGKPVVILTGGPGSSYLQLEEVAIRIGQTHNAILLEQRGTGKSQPHPYDTTTINLQTAMQDILLLLNHLKIDKVTLLGHSWGGMLAMSFAANYSERVQTLLLICPGPLNLDNRFAEIYSANIDIRLHPSEVKERKNAFKAESSNITPKKQLDIYKWELIPIIYDRTQVDKLIKIVNKGKPNHKTGAMLYDSFKKLSQGLSEKLSNLNTPVYIITGAQDPMAFSSYEIHNLMKRSELFWINRSGHLPMYEQPKLFYQILFSVLEK
jgi:pimeloyl-ACP methyl ester carboxylesterase